MTNFDYRKFLAEGKLYESTLDVASIAQQVADEFTKSDELDLKYVVTPGSVEDTPVGPRVGAGFDLDVEAGPNTPGEDWKDENGFGIDNYLGRFAGGSFTIKPEDDGYVIRNAAAKNAVVGYVTPEGELDFVRDQEQHYDEIEAQRKKETQMANVFVREENKSNKMKKSELKELIKSAFMAETTGAAIEAEDYDPVMEADEEVDAEVDAETTDVTVDDTETIDTETTAEVNPNVKAVQDSLTQAMEAAKSLGDKKLESQIGNTITFFTRSHVAGTDTGTMAEGEESLNEDLSSALTALIISIIAIPAIPITGALLMALIDYLFNELPEQRAEAKSLRSYKGPDKQEKVLALAKEIESKLSPGKKRYLKTLVDRIGTSKLEDKAKEYRELDRYAQSQKLDENLSTDIEAALKDLPIPSNEMEEGKKEYYKDAEADDAEHIKALEKDMEDDKEDSMKIGEVLFPMWTKIQTRK